MNWLTHNWPHVLLWWLYAREAYVILAGGFIVAMNLKRLRDSHNPQYVFWRNSVIELVVLAWIADVLFNQTYGRVAYGSWHKLKFTEHTQWVLDNHRLPSVSRKERNRALRWAYRLDAISATHIRIPTELQGIKP